MEEKKPIKMSFSTALLIIALIIIAIMGFVIYTIYEEKNLSDQEVISLQDSVDNLQNSVNQLKNEAISSNTLNNSTHNGTSNNSSNNVSNSNSSNNNVSNNSSKSNNIFDAISYMEIAIADNQNDSYDSTYLEPITINDTNTINNFLDEISNCKQYANFYDEMGDGDYFEGCPIVIIHQANGKIFELTASDDFSIDDTTTANIVDIKTINNYAEEDESYSDEVVYKTSSKFENFINEIFANNK